MLQNVVREGTGTLAAVPGYKVAGKTGTAQKPDEHGGYSGGRYVASFVGMVPASKPAARHPRHGRRAARRDLGRRRRGARLRADRRSTTCSTSRFRPTASKPLGLASRHAARASGPGARADRHRQRRAPSRSRTSRTTRAPSSRARSSSACAARTSDGHDLAAEAVGTRRRRARRRARARRSPCRSSSSPDARRAMAPAAVAFFGDPSRELDVAAVTGTAGKTTTTYLLYEILRAAGRRPGLLTNIERRVGDERAAGGAEHAGGDRPAAALPRDGRRRQHARARWRRRRTRRCRAASTAFGSPCSSSRTSRTSTSTSTGRWRSTSQAKRRLFAQAERAVVNVGDAWGRRLAAELDDRDHLRRRRATALDADLKLRGRFNLENALGAAAAARALGIGEDAIRDGIEARATACRGGSSSSTRASRSP